MDGGFKYLYTPCRFYRWCNQDRTNTCNLSPSFRMIREDIYWEIVNTRLCLENKEITAIKQWLNGIA